MANPTGEPHPFDLWFDTPSPDSPSRHKGKPTRSADVIMLIWGLGLALGGGVGLVLSIWIPGQWVYIGMGLGLIMSLMLEMWFQHER